MTKEKKKGLTLRRFNDICMVPMFFNLGFWGHIDEN